MSKEYIRNIINSIYDLQNLRISTGNRIMANMRMKLTGEASACAEELDETMGYSIKDLCKDYKRISDYMVENNVNLKKYFKQEHGLITDEMEYTLVDSYINMVNVEEKLTKQLAKELKKYPIYNEFMCDVKGCGTLMSGVIIAYLDPYEARHVSSFWRYVGVDVTFVERDGELVGEGTGAKHAKYNQIEYIDKNGEVQTKNGLSYNPFVKAKMCGVLATSFLMAGGKDKYAQTYRNVKMRYQNMPAHADKTPKHIDNMARRYMVKEFLRDLWVCWRKLEGLEVSEPYEVAVLGHKPHHTDPSVELSRQENE